VIVLAIDTAANLCAACAWDTGAGRELGRAVHDIGKGHAEVLMDMIGEALTAADGLTFRQVGAVAVAVGPGSFTGIRVGVAAARGLALALKVPAAGVSTLEALAFEARERVGPEPVLAAIDGGRDGIYAGLYDGGGELLRPAAVAELETVARLAREAAVLVGSAARRVREASGAAMPALGSEAATADIVVYARLAAARGFSGEKPRPLYLRAPDAKPQGAHILPRRQG
jgi:tRNA threonylcarbamoyl adenosine modification protein YeaZ